MGKTSFDKWDDFISQINAKGSTQLTDIYNAALTQYFPAN
jgi:hypothetical protein